MTGLIIDSFAGGGGASTGIEWALGRSPDYAINHDPEALAMHLANHPTTIHLTENVWKVDPHALVKGRRVELLWASPDCRHHSKAKGGAPVSRSVRGLADVVLVWARVAKPEVIALENVEEWRDWGPLDETGRPCPKRKGEDFARWVRALEAMGYEVDWFELCACDYGAPTIRKRLFLVARRDGFPIIKPAPTHGHPASSEVKAGKLKPWRTAAEIIDWHLPCPSIFLTRDQAKAQGLKIVRPLADKTLARVARGFKRYVLDRADPFIVPTGNGGDLAAVYLAQHNGGARGPLGRPADQPAATLTTEGSQVQPVMAYLSALQNNTSRGAPDEPLGTVLADGNHHAVVAPFIQSYYSSGGQNQAADRPLGTVPTKGRFSPIIGECCSPPLAEWQMERARQVAAFLRAEGVWSGGEFVTVGPYIVWDIGMRMLTPRELARAQGFPDSYVLATPLAKGGVLTETAQRHKIGNSVSPYPAAALLRSNMIDAREMPKAKRRLAALPSAVAPQQSSAGLFDGVAA